MPALTNLFQMFTNGGKLPLMIPQNSSTNLNLTSSHGGNLQDSSRSGLTSNTNPTTYNNDPTLFVCPSNPAGIGNVPQHQNGNSNGPLRASMYPNSANSMSSNHAGNVFLFVRLKTHRVDWFDRICFRRSSKSAKSCCNVTNKQWRFVIQEEDLIFLLIFSIRHLF